MPNLDLTPIITGVVVGIIFTQFMDLMQKLGSYMSKIAYGTDDPLEINRILEREKLNGRK